LVREALFNMVGELMPGRMAVDLFAGTGAIGLEALSRGAESAIFVEKNREAVALIHANVARLRYQDRAQIRLADAYRWVRTHEWESDRPAAVFLDPPYREYDQHAGKIRELLDQLIGRLPSGSVIALEAGRTLDDRILPDFDGWDVRRYGDTQVAIRVLPGPDGDVVESAPGPEAEAAGDD
jgi:16S rRNA (guanine966-N2)-methyltransferase